VPLILHKFERLGVRGIPLQLLSSALSDRTQLVRLKTVIGRSEVNVFSDELPVSRGTPQGGIVSPFYF
jgi:hypothetical protein